MAKKRMVKPDQASGRTYENVIPPMGNVNKANLDRISPPTGSHRHCPKIRHGSISFEIFAKKESKTIQTEEVTS